MATPDGPRPENLPPNYNPNALSNNMQNLQINQQQSSNLGGSAPRPNAAPLGQHPPPFARSRPGAPPPGAFPRGFVPPNLMSSRPTGPPPPGDLSSPGPFPPSHMSSEPTMPTHMRTWSPVSNGPPAPALGMIQNGPQFPPVIGGMTRPFVGPPQSLTFLSSEPSSQPPQMYPGFPSTMGQPAPPGPFLVSHSSSEPIIPTHMSSSNPISNGPLAPASGMIQNGPRFPPVMGNMPRLPVGLPHAPTLFSQPPQMHPSFSTPPHTAPSTMGLGSSLLSAPPQCIPPLPGPISFSAPVQGSFQSSVSSYGVQTWPPQQQQNYQVVSPLPSAGPMQQQQPMYGMPPPPLPTTGCIQQQQQMFGMPPPPLPNQSMILNQTEQSTIDPNQLPRPAHSSAVILHETRQDNQANPPPPVTSSYIVKDTGNCSPRYLRCTINQIPCTVDLLSTSAMQFALLVQPLALPHPSEDPIEVVDFRESGPVRCSRCKGYINPFMKFINQGKHFICNFCGFTDETPSDYFCNLGPDGRRRDADERPELCRGTFEFVASTEYMVRDPMPAVFFFLVDVSMNAIQTGATAAACSAINQCLEDLPEGPRTMVGIATFDSTIHFYNIKRAQQQLSMLIVPDIQEVYTPLQSDVVVQLAEHRQHLEILLESIPTTFQNNRTADSAFGAAVKAAFLAVKSSGGKLLVFQSVLPSIGFGSLSAREAKGRSNVSEGEKEANKLLQPVDKTLKPMAIEFAEHQVCVDLFITTQTYVDIASLSIVPRTTGGQVYYYYPFSALCDSAKLYNDLRWNVTRPQGYEAVMRVRCSQGIKVQDYFGNFCKRNPTDVDLPAIDCDKTIMVSLKHDDKLQEGTECAFQCALCYTTVYGQRRIRVSTLSLPCTNMLSNLFCFADVDTQFACILKQVANEVPSVPLAQVRDQVTNVCTNIFHAYRKHCASVSTSGQLRLPEALKVLPIYALALIKSSGLRSDGRIDERSFWINYVSPLPTPLVIPLVYPRMISIHDLEEKEMDDSVIPAHIPLSSEHVTDEGIYLLENGEDCLIYIGSSVQPNILQQLFSISSVEEISNQFILEQYDNPLSKKLNAIVNEIRHQRCSYLRLKLCRKGDPSGSTFFSYMIEDRTPSGHSYGDYLAHIHQKIRTKIA